MFLLWRFFRDGVRSKELAQRLPDRRIGNPRRLAHRQIHMNGGVFGRSSADVAGQVQELVTMLQDAFVGKSYATLDQELLAQKQFAFVADALFETVDREAAGGDIRIADTDRFNQVMLGIVEDMIVPTNIHMLVDIDPLRLHDAFKAYVKSRRRLLRVADRLAQWALPAGSSVASFSSSSDALQENLTLPRSMIMAVSA